MSALLQVSGLTKKFRRSGKEIAAVDGVSFTISEGETLALVGPSGSGKSTVARLLLRLIEPDGGTVTFRGADWLSLRGGALRHARQHMQMVFQDPLAAFNPRTTVGRAIADPLRIHGLAPSDKRGVEVSALLARVGLDPMLAKRVIHKVSGGQRQRVALARALAGRPSLLVLDEALSALDVSVRARMLDLLREIQRAENLAYLFIGHDLGVVRAIADRVAVMDAGRIVESGTADAVISAPRSAAGRALVAAVFSLRTNFDGR